MRTFIVWLAFLFLTYEVHSFVQYPIDKKINSIKSDNNSLSLAPLSIEKMKKNSKVHDDNSTNVQRRMPRDLTIIDEALSDTDSSVSFNITSDSLEISDHNDTLTHYKNNTQMTSPNPQNVTIEDSKKPANNTPTVHVPTTTVATTKTIDGNVTNYTNKLANVTVNVETHLDQLVNDTSGNDKIIENITLSRKSIFPGWKKLAVDVTVPGAQGQPSDEKNSIININNIKNALSIRTINITNENGKYEKLICTKISILPDHIRKSIIRKMDTLLKKTLIRLNIQQKNNDDVNVEEENDDDEYEEDNNDDEYEDDDDDDDCGCGCRRRCCGCLKRKKKKCSSCSKVVTPVPESGRRSGATFPINFESSEIVLDTTTPIETTEAPTKSDTTISSITPSSTTTSTTPLSTTISTTPSTTTTSTTPSTTTTTTTPSTTTISTTPLTTTTTTTPSTTTTTSTTSSTTFTPTMQSITINESITVSTSTTPSTTTIQSTTLSTPITTSSEVLTTKKRHTKRKKCNKKKRRKDGLQSSNNINGNTTMDNDNGLNVTEPTHLPFSGLLENQSE